MHKKKLKKATMKALESIIRLLGVTTQVLLYKHLAMILVLTMVISSSFHQNAYCMSSQNSYIAPEVLHSDFLSHRVHVNRKININKASMQELMTLPGVNEDIALKIMRVRPVEDIKDLKEIRYLSPKQIQTLIDAFTNRVAY